MSSTVNIFIPLDNQKSMVANIMRNQQIPFCVNVIDFFNKELTLTRIPIANLTNYEIYSKFKTVEEGRREFFKINILGIYPVSFEIKDDVVGVLLNVNKSFGDLSNLPKSLKVVCQWFDDMYKLGFDDFLKKLSEGDSSYGQHIYELGLVAFVSGCIGDYNARKNKFS